jgi:hypothetical protein
MDTIANKIDKLDEVQRAGLELMILYKLDYGISGFKSNAIKQYSKEWELSEEATSLKIEFLLHLHLNQGEEVRRLCTNFLYPYTFDVLQIVSDYKKTMSSYKRLYNKSKSLNSKIDSIIVDIFKANKTFRTKKQYFKVLEPLLLQYTI